MTLFTNFYVNFLKILFTKHNFIKGIKILILSFSLIIIIGIYTSYIDYILLIIISSLYYFINITFDYFDNLYFIYTEELNSSVCMYNRIDSNNFDINLFPTLPEKITSLDFEYPNVLETRENNDSNVNNSNRPTISNEPKPTLNGLVSEEFMEEEKNNFNSNFIRFYHDKGIHIFRYMNIKLSHMEKYRDRVINQINEGKSLEEALSTIPGGIKEFYLGYLHTKYNKTNNNN